MKNYIIKIDRFFAWVLFFGFVLFFITGYGMTKGIISSPWIVSWHNKVLPPIVLISFCVHAGYATSLAFRRWKVWNIFTRLFLWVFFIGLLAFFMYLGFFYTKKTGVSTTNSNSTSQTSNQNNDESQSTNNSTQTSSKLFTLTELAKYNGKNGQPSYIAVDGVVYDVSTLFINGTHRGCSAGQDVTSQFYSYHIKSILSGYTIVGSLQK
jgi:predicted heme/steroid binding protein